ncbi:hypothetical protein [Actinokineospora xionganensis]|uniref:Uncharacterized protein n=1 Tax=Actinokineospora xionganensis TaxID=2684470 RepID=A0ABR7LGY9_9PSEU|nr:hypothetical protein [Actinokineospora xionganensis]MBC6451641.1 hypothetical protein [Actinokineospora xionganensis]
MTAPTPLKHYKQLLLDLNDVNQALRAYLESVIAARSDDGEAIPAITESNLGSALVEVGLDLIARAAHRVPDAKPGDER